MARVYTEIIWRWDEAKGKLVQESQKSFEYSGEWALLSDGGSFGDFTDWVADTADKGGDVLEDVGDIAEDAGQVVVDVLEDVTGQDLDGSDSGNYEEDMEEFLEDIESEAEDMVGDYTEPTWTVTSSGALKAVSKISGVPVLYGTRKISGIKIYEELMTTTQTANGITTVTQENWFQIFLLSEGGGEQLGGVDGVWCNGEFHASPAHNTAQKEGATSGGWNNGGSLIEAMEGAIKVHYTVTHGYAMGEGGSSFTQEPWDGATPGDTLEWIEAGGTADQCKGQNMSLAFVRMEIRESQDNKARNLPKLEKVLRY